MRSLSRMGIPQIQQEVPQLPHAPPVAVIDLETTGLDPAFDRVIELAVYATGADPLCTLVNPGLDLFPSGVHGITPAAVCAAPSFEEIAGSLQELLDDRILVAHNAAFDISFISAEFKRAGLRWKAPEHICTVAMANSLGLGHESRRLTYACERHGVPLVSPHEAAADALAAAGLFALYARIAAAQGCELRSFVAVGHTTRSDPSVSS